MKEYITIELENKNKYVAIDMIKLQDNKYFLLAELSKDETDIDSTLDICIYNEQTNSFIKIENEFEYQNILYIFEKRLETQRKKITQNDTVIIPNMIKLKVINIEGYNYTLQKENNKTITMNLEIYGNKQIEINNYIYIKKETLEEKNFFQYGPIFNKENEIIKVLTDTEEYYLQRYYG